MWKSGQRRERVAMLPEKSTRSVCDLEDAANVDERRPVEHRAVARRRAQWPADIGKVIQRQWPVFLEQTKALPRRAR